MEKLGTVQYLPISDPKYRWHPLEKGIGYFFPAEAIGTISAIPLVFLDRAIAKHAYGEIQAGLKSFCKDRSRSNQPADMILLLLSPFAVLLFFGLIRSDSLVSTTKGEAYF